MTARRKPMAPARRAGPVDSGRRAAMAALPMLALAGCGFHLRRSAELPFDRLALTGFSPDSPLAAQFRQTLAGSAEIVETPAQAAVVLRALADVHERSVVASTSAGQVREIQLRLQFSARADTPEGKPLLAPFTLRLTRELSYSESAALAKAQEQEALFQEMRIDVVDQVLRRLATVRP